MSGERRRSRGPVWISVAIGLFLLAAYVAGYIWTGTVEENPMNLPLTFRTYHTRFECRLFYPLGWLEAKTRRKSVKLCSPSRYYFAGRPKGNAQIFVFQP